MHCCSIKVNPLHTTEHVQLQYITADADAVVVQALVESHFGAPAQGVLVSRASSQQLDVNLLGFGKLAERAQLTRPVCKDEIRENRLAVEKRMPAMNTPLGCFLLRFLVLLFVLVVSLFLLLLLFDIFPLDQLWSF